MRRTSLYSRSVRAPGTAAAPEAPGSSPAAPAAAAAPAPEGAAPAPPANPGAGPRMGTWVERQAVKPLVLWSAIALLGLACLSTAGLHLTTARQQLTQQDIDSAVQHSLQNQPLPSATAKAYDIIAPSVVRVIGLMDEKDDYKPEREAPRDPSAAQPGAAPGSDSASGGAPEHGPGGEPSPPPALVGPLPLPQPQSQPRGQGTGVVIVDTGVILTNFHVVHGAKRIKVEFHNGLVSDAELVGLHPEHDLAVLKAQKIPDDLPAATLRSTGGLRPGDNVAAVGFPFGIGPSVSSGVVSGLRREFRTADGERVLTNLIQFDAAANPGNSGGPLITMEGDVVGIVTAILNPTEQRTFIGIGFAVPIENAAALAGMPPF